jgi:hypothetical protein
MPGDVDDPRITTSDVQAVIVKHLLEFFDRLRQSPVPPALADFLQIRIAQLLTTHLDIGHEMTIHKER